MQQPLESWVSCDVTVTLVTLFENPQPQHCFAQIIRVHAFQRGICNLKYSLQISAKFQQQLHRVTWGHHIYSCISEVVAFPLDRCKKY